MNNNNNNNDNIDNNNNNNNNNNMFRGCCSKFIDSNDKIDKQKQTFKFIIIFYIIFSIFKIFFVSSNYIFISFLGIIFIVWTNNTLYYTYTAIAIFIFIYYVFLLIQFIGILFKNLYFNEISRLENKFIIKFIFDISIFELIFLIFFIILLYDYYKNLKIKYYEQYALNWPRNNRIRFRNNNQNNNQNNRQINNNNNNLNNNNNQINLNNNENHENNLLNNENNNI